MDYARKIDADLHLTSLHLPMQDIYNSYQTPGYLTQIFVLTDGEVSVKNLHKIILTMMRHPIARNS